MEMKIEVHGDIHEDCLYLKNVVNAQHLHESISEALELIRSRLKWGENVTDEEERTLEEIRLKLITERMF